MNGYGMDWIRAALFGLLVLVFAGLVALGKLDSEALISLPALLSPSLLPFVENKNKKAEEPK